MQRPRGVETIGRLAAGLAHDYNNILTVISGNTQLLLAEEGLPSHIVTELEEIARAADRATVLTRQLLAFSQQQMLRPVVLNLNDIISGMSSRLRRVAGDGVIFRWLPAPGLRATFADRAQIEQVVLNLVTNARDAMPAGGELEVSTMDVTVNEDFAAGHAPMPTGEFVCLKVRDTGVGMDEQTRARVFEPFFTTKEPSLGAGLGLSMVYGVVKQSGGYVFVDSHPGQGSTFAIFLPTMPNEIHDAEPATRPHERTIGETTILVVEDEDLVRRMTQRSLERAGYKVISASNADEALALSRSPTQPIHLLLSDIVMPGMNGRDLAVAMRHSRPSLRVLLMSGYAHVREGLAMDEVDFPFLQKPFTVRELVDRVSGLLADMSLAR
jgi:two-component system, cell cycle sensor histidine kinase and response regulator CckA